MRSHLVLLGALLLFPIRTVSAAPITYIVNVDTSSISGTAGSLDFNFNPGPLQTQSANVEILGFFSDGVLGTASTVGNVTGTLPSTLTFDNGTAFNDYFQTFVFGSTLSFSVSLDGPALSSPDGVSTSGSTFAFSMFSDPAGTLPALTTDTTNGFAYVVNVNLDGSTTATSFISGGNTNVVPEPGSASLVLIAALISLLVAGRMKWQLNRSATGI